jgi:two-component system, NarL family, nitrate/nitrite response regulator NarL
MSGVVQNLPEGSRIPTRILIAGCDLLAGALANALTAYGFATRHVVPRAPEIGRGVEWRPNLVLIDVRSLDVTFGAALLAQVRRAGPRVCVIDASDEAERLNTWRVAGASALIDRREPFDHLFRTVNLLLRSGSTPNATTRPSAPLSLAYASKTQEPQLQPFADLTEREKVVLAELIEGHCAEEIANGSFVSISTVRSQIKAILQKLGVNSQLAAVALARRAGWSLGGAQGDAARPSGSRPARVS